MKTAFKQWRQGGAIRDEETKSRKLRNDAGYNMEIKHVLIQMSMDEPFWLDGYNGKQEWEWTQDKKRAWHLRPAEAVQKLTLMKELFPSALLIEV